MGTLGTRLRNRNKSITNMLTATMRPVDTGLIRIYLSLSVTPDFVPSRINFYFFLSILSSICWNIHLLGKQKVLLRQHAPQGILFKCLLMNLLSLPEVQHSKVTHIEDILGALSACPWCFNQGCVVKLEHCKAKGQKNRRRVSQRHLCTLEFNQWRNKIFT